MSTPLQLRPYQEQALTDLWDWFVKHDKNALVVLPTGSGKSLVIAEWCRLVFDTDPSACIIVLAHVRELVQQNAAELAGLWPEAPWGVYSAGLGRRDIGAQLMFASIQSIAKKAYRLPRRVDMVLVDECHLIPRSSDTLYGKFLSDLKIINPAVKVVGFTATPFRMDSGMLHDGDGAMFDGIAHETNVRELIEDGWLCPPIGPAHQSCEIDTTGIGTRAGEFIAAQLESAALDPAVIAAIADTIVAKGQNRRGWLVFGCTVKHCEVLRDALQARGYDGEGVFGDTETKERDRIISDFKAGKLRFLVSQGVLTTGFNAKNVDLIALARPTKSTGLFVQMVGRGTRCIGSNIRESAANGKTDCMILDFGGNIARHGPFDDPSIPIKGAGRDGDAPYKECPQCKCACSTMSRLCPQCGFEFPPPERRVDIRAAEKPILSAIEPEWLPVARVTYRRHEKLGSPASLRVDYQVGMTFQREWICLDHSGYARTKAESWWLRRGSSPVPRNVDEALGRTGELAAATHIRVKREGQYDRITSHQLGPKPETCQALAS
jgi:DNA repair protein RadD